MSIDKVMKCYYALVALFGISPFLCLGLMFILNFLFGCSASFSSGDVTCRIVGINFEYIYGGIVAWAHLGVFISPLVSVFAGAVGAIFHWLFRESVNELRKSENRSNEKPISSSEPNSEENDKISPFVIIPFAALALIVLLAILSL